MLLGVYGFSTQATLLYRSHVVFTLYLERRSGSGSREQIVRSKLHLVDLAGSERTGKTGSGGNTFKEATYINKSLTFLEQVVVALVDKGRDHIPYRQTKLTNVLKVRLACVLSHVTVALLLMVAPFRFDVQDSLGGNCRTRVVACVWSTDAHFEETLATLRFATRMMRVKTRPSINAISNNGSGGGATSARYVHREANPVALVLTPRVDNVTAPRQRSAT